LGRRKPLPVAQLDLVGGLLCLDLANTTGARASGVPRERLRSYDDLLVWSRRASILGAAEAGRLRKQAAQRPAEAKRALGRVRELREELYRLFRAIAEGGEPSPESLRQLGKWWRADRQRRELTAGDRGFTLRLQISEDELDAMVWPIVISAVELLVSHLLTKLKRCGECDWLFVDASKNGSRMWCKKQCGDRVRARRHYGRLHRSPTP
jgi:predicted RNA-binding Zn ribbon-like protein